MKLSGYNPLRKLLPAAALLLATLWACTGYEEEIVKSGNGDALVTFSLRVPGESVPGTRALTDVQENAVKEIDVLVFEKNGGVYAGAARCSGNQITGTGSVKNFTVTLPRGEYDLAVLANAHSALPSTDDLTGKNKATVLSALTDAVPSGGKWPADGTKPFPMWADIGTKTIDETTEIKGVSLLRMVAGVDVKVTAEKFTLTSVHVYNYNTHGALVPAAAAIPGGGVTYPSVPATSTLTEGPILYDGAAINTTDNQCVSEIYLMESENHTDGEHEIAKDLLKRTCLVVGGTYDTDNKSTYYRVDFSEGTGASQTFLDVLRNCKYTVNITKVSGPGYEDEDIAFHSGPVNIEASVLTWSAAGMNIITTDGQYTLAVNKDEYTFTREAITGEAAENMLKVWTDYTDGWKVEKCVDADGEAVDWLKLVPDGDDGGKITETYIKLLKENTTGEPRSAEIYLEAGRIRKPIMVTQSTESKPTIPRFAYTNIVLYKKNQNSDERLSFQNMTHELDNMDGNVQGVFFKWGSLVAINPATGDFNIVFTPNGYEGDAINSWNDIPYANDMNGIFDNDDPSEDDFEGYGPGGKGYDVTRGVGDICRYISDQAWVADGVWKWRLPTSSEQQALLKVSGKSWTNSGLWGSPTPSAFMNTSTSKSNGQSIMFHYVDLNGNFFPAAGWRSFDGKSAGAGATGYYWSGSSNTSSNAWIMTVDYRGADWNVYQDRHLALPIRCVREAR